MGRLKDFVITRKIPVPLSGHFQELGQLQPWYMQKEGEQIFLEYYTTFQGRLLAEPRLEPSTELRVGQLCIVPEFVSVWTRDVAAYKVKTCLGAYVVPSSTSYMGHQQEAYPVVQWDDGSRTFGRDRGGPQPMALTEEHLYKRVPRAKANAV